MNRQLTRTILAHHDGKGGVHHDAELAHTIYQTSTMAALLDGIYDGDVTIAELLEHGDFGLGTFNHLDGEMVVLDGTCYHLRADGSATVAAPDDLTPFAVVTEFIADTTIEVVSATKPKLTEIIDKQIPSENLLYAIRIEGTFRRVATRTVTQQKPPYPPLTQATAGQAEREFRDVAGTLAGFRTPDYEQGLSVAGYHLHFIDEARTSGGHALDFELARGQIALSISSDLHLSLPRSGPFLHARLSATDLTAQIHQTEG
jgi:acetolactate decarboxylase